MKQPLRSGSILIGALTACLVALGGVLAGSLTPPGPPAPTMKTLVDVEPRTAIHGSNLPLTINAPGSYYLAENIATAGNGIIVNSSNVTIDLNGFTFRGGTGDGISIPPPSKIVYTGIVVRNGTVAGWTGNGVNLQNATDSGVLDILALGNQLSGITLGDRGFATHCSSNGNHIDGIGGNTNETVSDCAAVGNGGRGIVTGDGSMVEKCVANGNTDQGILVTGSRVTGCEVSGNGLSPSYDVDIECTASTIRDCMIHTIREFGIISHGSSHIVGNRCVGTGSLASSTGIYAVASGDLIEGNSVFAYSVGIDVLETGNTVIKNVATGNTSSNYVIFGGNDAGPTGSAASATNPWANIGD